MSDSDNVYIAAIIFVLLALGTLIVIFPTNKSIVSLSSISFSGNQTWVTSVAINQSYETIEFAKYTPGCSSPSCAVSTNSDGSQNQAQSTIDITFNQQVPYCTYTLNNASYPVNVFGVINLNNYNYFTLQNPQLHTPYSITVQKNGGTVDSQVFDASNSVYQATTTMANGQVKINNLGQLSGGVNCPAAGTAVLVPIYASDNSTIQGYKLVDASQLQVFLNNLTQAANGVVFGNISALSSLLSAPPLSPPSGFYNTSPNIQNVTASSNSLTVNLPQTSAYAFVTAEVSAQLADTVTYYPPNPKPAITSWKVNNGVIAQTAQTTATANFTNTGTSGTFNVSPYSTNGLVSFSPTTNSLSLAANSGGSMSFQVYGAIPGQDSICVKITGVESGASANQCTGLTVQPTQGVPAPSIAPVQSVTPPQISPQPMNNTSPSPSPSIAPLRPLTCGVFQVPIVTNQPTYTLLWQTGTATTSTCGIDWGSIIIVLAALGVFGYIYLNKEGGA